MNWIVTIDGTQWVCQTEGELKVLLGTTDWWMINKVTITSMTTED